MLVIIFRRLGQSILVLFLVALISFLIFRYVGNPVDNLMGQEATLAQRAALEEALGLNDPFYKQYFSFVWNALNFDFGNSYRGALPVSDLIASRLPATIELALTSAIFALFFGVITGIYTAIRRGGYLANIILSTSLIGVSLPTFLIGVLLIWLFAVELKWLPSFGRGDVVQLGWWSTGFLTLSGIKSLILPSITLGLYQLTLIMRLTRSEMLEVMRQDYVRFAKALGLSSKQVNYKHALPNTLVPVVTIAGLQLGSIVAFAIVRKLYFSGLVLDCYLLTQYILLIYLL